ncbi:MAG TPA: ABC transporter permease [Sulfolobales archaeon]|nr:ABC transporter permease [Sulfolobales archaeon]
MRRLKAFDNVVSLLTLAYRDKSGLLGLIIVSLIALIGIIVPYLPLPYYDDTKFQRFSPPSLEHPFGTDHLGRDVFSRALWGARTSLIVGLVAAGIASLIGIILGAISGYWGGLVDEIIGRVIDIFLLIPGFFLALLLVAIYGSNIMLLVIVIGITTWPVTARVMRAQVLSVKSLPYVEVARALGSSNSRILLIHIIPSAIQPVIALTVLQIGSAIVIEAGLSYLGLGDPNFPSWGRIIYEGQLYILSAWWITIFPALLLLITILGFNLLGDFLYRVLTPKARS